MDAVTEPGCGNTRRNHCGRYRGKRRSDGRVVECPVAKELRDKIIEVIDRYSRALIGWK